MDVPFSSACRNEYRNSFAKEGNQVRIESMGTSHGDPPSEEGGEGQRVMPVMDPTLLFYSTPLNLSNNVFRCKNILKVPHAKAGRQAGK